MSGFDEEAERERLREKYEQDREKRAATQRMSELLLKGATMTNSHCDTCGDPLFRHDGQTFCPTCQAAEREAAAQADDASDAADTEAATPDGASPATATETATPDDASPPTDTTRDRRAPPSAGSEPPVDAGEGQVRDPAAGRIGATRADRASSTGATASLDDARSSLSRTLARYARAAEETDDPRRARELLAAAREAAETLAALDRR